jgi:hypothetical protein
MATSKRKTSKSASKDVESAMRKRKRGTLKSGGSGKKVTSKKQAIAIGLSEARKKGKKVARKKSLSEFALLRHQSAEVLQQDGGAGLSCF